MRALRSDRDRALRLVWLAAWALVCLVLLREAGSTLGAPPAGAKPVTRMRPALLSDVPPLPEVYAHGPLRRRTTGSVLPPLCDVTLQRLARAGDARKGDTREADDARWINVRSTRNSDAVLDVAWSSAELPSSVALSSSFLIDFGLPSKVEHWEGERAVAWARRLGKWAQPFDPGTQRFATRCFDEGERVYVQGCVSSSAPGGVSPCRGSFSYYVSSYDMIETVEGFAIAARSASVAATIAWAFLSLLVGALAFVRVPPPLITQLEARGGSRRPARLVPRTVRRLVIAFVGIAFLFASVIETKNGGFVWGVAVAALWLVAALERWSHRARAGSALAPVIDTPRSLLAEAEGTVELAVRARMRGAGVRSVVGGDAVAFSEVRVREVYLPLPLPLPRSREVHVHRVGEELGITDESGDGVLRLDSAIVDVEVRRARVRRLPPQLDERGVARAGKALYYVIEERVIADGAALYVFGDVSDVELRADGGYRSVRGAPTLGGAGRPPVLVYSGDERGLIAALRARVRAATSLSIAAALASAVLVAALTHLARS